MSPSDLRYVRYSDSIETKQPNEDELIDQIVASMARVNRRVFDQHRHGTRDAHAKSHGVLKGELTVYDKLPEYLRQGVFRAPRRYPVIVRLSSAPGNIHSDAVPAPFGFAIKLIGVEGKKILPGAEDEPTQDFLLVNNPTIPFGHVKAYWSTQQLAERIEGTPDLLLRAGAAVAGVANAALGLVGRSDPLLQALAVHRHHILGETFHSMGALRYGEYFGKISAAPLSENVRRLTGQPLHPEGNDSVVRDLVVDFFKREGAEYELRVQLCTDVERMPVEDASVEWSEAESPHQPIAKLAFPPQDAYSPARRVYADDVLSFNPWHCIADHRPLGSIMRVRIKAYETSSKYRHEMNARARVEPRDVSELPE